MPKKTRLRWVDAAKALAIVAIITGHVTAFYWSGGAPEWAIHPWAQSIEGFVYSFHVPLFFILSGYTTAAGLMSAHKVGKLFARTFLPYIVTAAMTLVYVMAVLPDQNIFEWLAAVVYGSGLYRGELVAGYPFGVCAIGAIWFLPALFFGKIFASWISKTPWPARIALAVAMFYVGSTTAGILFLPLDIQQGMCAAIYITCGMMMRQYGLFEDGGAKKALVSICAAGGGAYMAAGAIVAVPVAMPCYTNSIYPNGALDMIGTVLASIAVMTLGQLMAQAGNPFERAVELLGRSTLPVFCFHSVMMSAGFVFNSGIAHKICAHGVPPSVAFPASVAFCVAVPVLFALLARITPGLRQVYYPGTRPYFAEKRQKAEEQSKISPSEPRPDGVSGPVAPRPAPEAVPATKTPQNARLRVDLSREGDT